MDPGRTWRVLTQCHALLTLSKKSGQWTAHMLTARAIKEKCSFPSKQHRASPSSVVDIGLSG